MTATCWSAAEPCFADGIVSSGASGGSFAKHVTHPTNGVDQSRLAVGLGLAAQVTDVHLERITRRREIETPHLLENAAARQYPSRIGDQHLQQSEFGAGKADLPLPAGHFAGYRIKAQVRERHRHRFGGVVNSGASK